MGVFQVEINKLDRKDLQRYLVPLLAQSTDDSALRPLLEEVANANRHFSSLVNLWGPQVYRKNRILFRPLIVAHFAFFYWDVKFHRVRWNSQLDEWLAEVEANGDTALARRLIQWKLIDRSKGKFSADAPLWRQELVRRFDAAGDHASRMTELEKMAFGWGSLDEPTARHLYDLDAESSRKFILEWLPGYSLWRTTEFWEQLIAHARDQKDDEFARELYRKQVSPKHWTADALALCRQITDATKLIEELERIHPLFARDLGAGMMAILEVRGRDVVPFVMRHMRSVFTGWFGRGEFGKILKIAATNQWWDLWACALRTSASTKEFNEELGSLLGNRSISDDQVRERLIAVTGVSREWNFSGFGLATIHNLDEANALALYNRFPDLLRGPFKVHLHGRWARTPRQQLIERLIAAGAADEELLDFLASRYTTNRVEWRSKKIAPEADQLADYYLALRDKDSFARRAAAVLGQIPAFAIRDYATLIRENRLARLLFERSLSSYLAEERAVADLVEASEIHVMGMAYRILGLDDERSRRYAIRHLPLLLGTLLRPMHRSTRAAAFGALLNAAQTNETAARAVLNKAREALALPDKKYPKEELVGLIGKVIHRWPSLRKPSEAPVIYRRSPAA